MLTHNICCVYLYVIYIYIYIEREREKEIEREKKRERERERDLSHSKPLRTWPADQAGQYLTFPLNNTI